MDQPTRRKIEEVLQKLGKEMEGLHELYKQALENIERQTDVIRSLARQTLTWITRAKRPLSITEIQHALAISEDMTAFDSVYMPDARDLQSICAGLVTIDEESGVIRLVHYSAQEFLQRSQEKWFPEGESYITKKCLAYLSFTTFGDALCWTDKGLEDHLRKNSFYGYAACNWGHHTRESSISQLEILSFLESPVNVEASSQVLTADRHNALLRRAADNQLREPTKMTELHLAAYFGINRVVDIILHSRNNPPDLKDIYGRTPLSWVAENGHVPVVEQLIATGQIEIDSEDRCGMRPLIWAAKEGHATVAQLLLDAGAHPNSQNYSHRTSLSYAAENGHIEVTQLLLDRGAETETWNENMQWHMPSPLSYAAQHGHIAIVERLLEAGAEINSKFRDIEGRTPLIWAIRGKQKAAVELMLKKGADINMTDVWEKSPLSFATELMCDDIAQLLLDRGAKP